MAETGGLPRTYSIDVFIDCAFSLSVTVTNSTTKQLYNFTGKTFTGELLDKPDGTKIYDFTFNTPANDGIINATLTKAQTATIEGRKLWYWIKVDDILWLKGEALTDVSGREGS